MLNIMNNVINYMNNQLNPYSQVNIDMFRDDYEDIICRHEPSNIPETRYLNGNRIGKFNFSVYAKSLNGEKAVNQLNTFIDDFEIKTKFEIDPLLWVKIEPTTEVRFISKSDKNEYIYTSSFTLEYEKQVR